MLSSNYCRISMKDMSGRRKGVLEMGCNAVERNECGNVVSKMGFFSDA